ncbi:MAG: stage II sporulation protein P [Clostridiales bacterium]|jgi:stage II sporulation protein P|nr:stage II sporulation protein P [Clostridiales bacterium]
MARGAFFSVRGKKRWNRRNKSSRVFFTLMISLLLVTGAVRYLSQATVPVMAATTGARTVTSLLPDRQTVLLHILGQVIPGFEQPDPVGNSNNDAYGEIGIQAVSRFDPRDPKRILAAQIPYMSDVQPALQPLLRQVNSVPENEEAQRKIIIPSPTAFGSGDGKVVIYHTHTTESFVPTSGKKFTEELDLTVAKLGEELASILLETYGIPVVHNNEIHDIPRSTSYEKALPTVKRLLEENADTKILIDLHRDGVDRKISTTQINGQNMGRILFVVGSSHPRWQENYQKALFLHDALEEMAPGISRGVRERPLVYNQHVHPGALLIELGGHENSLVEVQRVLPILARAIDLLYNN